MKTKFWYVQCNTDIDQYEYITMTEPKALHWETAISFIAQDARELLEATDSIAGYCLDDVFEIDGLIPLFETCLGQP